MNIALCILQSLLGLYFFLIGIIYFVIPPGLPAMMSWMYELSPTLHSVSGTLEILGGLGLILPSVTKIQPRLTPLAGAGLALVMAGALTWHLQRGEPQNMFLNVILAVIAASIAYGRWKLVPIQARGSNAAP